MTSPIACRYCGTPVSYEEEDRGFEVYCISCGRANEIPAGPEVQSPGPTDAKAARVFSAVAAAQLEDRVVGETTCLCGVAVPLRIGDFGGTIYCPQCSTELQVGKTLEEYRRRSVPRAQAAPPEASPSAPPRPHRHWFRSTLALAALTIVLAAAALGSYVLWQHPQMAERVVTFVLPANRPEQPFEPSDDDPDAALPPDDTPIAKSLPEVEPEEPVTLEAIEGLLGWADLSEALAQAQIWLETLHDQDVPEDDPRRKRLARIIERLQEKLAPSPAGPPPQLAEFDRRLDSVVGHLKAGDLDAAREGIHRAEDLVRQHQQVLAPYCQRLLFLKDRVRQAEARTGGVERIRERFEYLERALQAGKVTEALEAEAAAKFLALGTPMTDQDFAELDAREKQAAEKLRLARGRRAVEDALRCHEAREFPARDREVRRAFSILPGLPEGRIRPLLDKVREWQEDAQKQSKQSGSESAIGREIERRDAYEDVVDLYGAQDPEALIEACLNFDRQLAGENEQTKKFRTRNRTMLFNVLEREITSRLRKLSGAGEQELLERLIAAQQLLDKAGKWQDHHRWQALNGALRQHGSQLAAPLLENARALAKEDRLREAVEEAGTVETLGDPDLAKRAAALRRKWQAEIDLRRSRHAQRQSWERIERLRRAGNKPLKLLEELHRFRQRYPRSDYNSQLEALIEQTQATVQQRLAETFEWLEHLFEAHRYAEVREAVSGLRWMDLPATQRETLEGWKARLAALKEQAEQEMLFLQRHRRLITEDDVLTVLEAVPRILAMDPDLEEAVILLEEAQEKAAFRAERLLASALLLEDVRPKLYVERLHRVVRLDTNGPHGKKAQQRLAK